MPILASAPEPVPERTVLAQCVSVTPSGKRHQSWFYEFEVKRVLTGHLEGTHVGPIELFSDFGGKQLNAMLGGVGFPHPLVLRLRVEGKRTRLRWAVQEPDVPRMEALDRAMVALARSLNKKSGEWGAAVERELITAVPGEDLYVRGDGEALVARWSAEKGDWEAATLVRQ